LQVSCNCLNFLDVFSGVTPCDSEGEALTGFPKHTDPAASERTAVPMIAPADQAPDHTLPWELHATELAGAGFHSVMAVK
jgi:hypothetical protein